MQNRTIAFIFARGGSKGVAEKNIRPLAGRPLIAYAIDAALSSRYVSRVVVSTDSERIAEIARSCGAEVPFMRPVELAQDNSPEWLAWRHALIESARIYTEASCPIFLSVPATCPLRLSGDIDQCVEALLSDADADIAITTTAAHSNPYFTMVIHDAEGYAHIAATPATPVSRRQDAPPVDEIIGVAYAARPHFVLQKMGLWEGKVKSTPVPQERAIDIDTEHDFLVAELLMRERLRKNS